MLEDEKGASHKVVLTTNRGTIFEDLCNLRVHAYDHISLILYLNIALYYLFRYPLSELLSEYRIDHIC